METLDNLDRLTGPVTHERLEPYLRTGRPVICTQLFPDGELAPQAELAPVIERFGDAPTPVDPTTTVRTYFGQPSRQRGSIGLAMPAELEASVLAASRGSVVAREGAKVVAWMGRAGCLQRLHCDMDCADNFLYQLHGSKRVCLVSPAASQKLHPTQEPRLLLAEVPFQFFGDRDKLAFLRYCDGFDGELRPGETLYIPPLWWHFVEYLTDSFSLSWRNVHPGVEDLASAWSRLWPTEWPLWQGIVWRLSSDADAVRTYGPRVRALLAKLGEPEGSAASELFELHAELCPGRYERPFSVGDAPFFEPRSLRPLPRKYGPWREADVPRVQPYVRFVAVPEGMLVIDGSRVAAEIEIDDDERGATLAIIDHIDGRATIADIATRTGQPVAAACDVIAQLGGEGWIS